MTGYRIKPKEERSAITPTVIELLQALADGEMVKEFAARHGFSYQTAKNTVKRAMDALGADTKEQAVAMALRRGIIT